MECIEKFCCLIIYPMSFITPVKRFPEIALLVFFVATYFMCEFILTVFNVFSAYTGLNHPLVGLTLMVWGSNNLELINIIIAMKNGLLELGMTSVMTSIIFCFTLCIPIAAIARMETRDEWEIHVLQTHHSRNVVVLPCLIVCVLSFLILSFIRFELDRLSSLLLILIYAGYVTHAFMYFGEDEDD